MPTRQDGVENRDKVYCCELGKKFLEIREVAKKLRATCGKHCKVWEPGGIEGRKGGVRYNRQREEREVAGGSSSTGGGTFGPPVFVTKRQMGEEGSWFWKIVTTIENSLQAPD